MKVGELIEILLHYPPEMEVKATWEGTIQEFGPEHIFQGPIMGYDGFKSDKGKGSLLIDADYHDFGSYKPDDAIHLHLKED